MKHQKEWHTCDRCGTEIKKGILCGNSITKNGILNDTYDLCYKCMEDFATLQEIGDGMGITRERVRQIENQAYKKLKSHLKNY